MKKRMVDDRSRVHAITAGSSLVTVLQEPIFQSIKTVADRVKIHS